jgi:hypothetical protein
MARSLEMAIKLHIALTGLVYAAVITTDSVDPLHALAFGMLAGLIGWTGWGLYLVTTDALTLKKFFGKLILAAMAGGVFVAFVPLKDFIQLMAGALGAGVLCEPILKRFLDSILNLFGNSVERSTDK